ncbi:MAG TPA: 2-C-methyl-D-erythritol 2,4-cyclodiphosphate synthase [Candidatus Dormibacteraeota bacterium]|nr:2-C-methyl-D-erythritol 2,4-cyclodiphosphate synthase [Candidatus Dormibacteraeota bacterium]
MIAATPGGADAIVVAAGSSRRMGGTDKLSHEIGGRPLLAWSIDALTVVPEIERVVVVTAADRVAELRGAPWLPAEVVAVVAGGARRHESVAAGAAALDSIDAPDDRVVLVHDGARPLVSAELVRAILDAAAREGAAIPVVPIAETVKRVENGRVAETVDREELATAQTPQGVRRGLLRSAFARYPPGGPETWTDEAALLEACRIVVHAIPGETSNLKVTVPADLDRVRSALGGAASGPGIARIGSGSDSHPFGPGAPLALGGIEVAGAYRLHGHSDGDVALHAVADALLGAAGMGDLGRLFPAGPETPHGIASRELLAEVARRLTAAGWRVSSVDLTIVGARPRLAGLLDGMRDAIAGTIGVPGNVISVKASTGNLAGMEGAGRGISATAVAAIERSR